MLEEKDIKRLIEKVIAQMVAKEQVENKIESVDTQKYDEDLRDLVALDLKEWFLVEDAHDKNGYMKMKAYTPARIGVGRAGVRYKTDTMLRFRADHAAAQDAVFTDVSDDFINELKLFSVKTKCKDKDEFLTRPDLGKQFDEDQIGIIKDKCNKKPQVQIYVSDGLSSTAIEANVKDVLPAIMQGLESYGISVGTPFFVKYGRVGAMDEISEALDADVTCVLIGERPGLITAESMSAYIAYKATIGMPESRRNVISNIHKGGTPPVEAGAHIAEVIKIMLDKKISGVELKL
ncbi:ethanolamine ammonia-lyase subunit EutC [Crassaminicella indica]|uniref:Ethanolamine ammonia-lyase small subunit n=1 Tax=Crassaminicella indica TaxID=2855394 RepID=A0ABX8RBT9_9CLOT|nr:ethanolamine ammonia-lyase subunit EutC [Crassaminicella indica]QXM06522.1 ethanolamine ammonia-lyase subunit EutC [Crassaminicella indica]